ncbi:MAG: hypothetical protein ACC628_18050 [Pirellulaceae bacterium]
MVAIVRPRFELGRVLATPAALRVLEDSGRTPHEFLHRHVRGDWGDLSTDDCKANEAALRDGSRIFSAYITGSGKKIWIITEAVNDQGRRVSTTVLLPDEY